MWYVVGGVAIVGVIAAVTLYMFVKAAKNVD